MDRFKRWVLYGSCLPERLNPVQARQQRLLRYTQWLVVLLIAIFWLMALVQWIPIRIIGLSVALVLALAAVFARRGYHPAHWSMAGAGCAIITASCTNGGLGSVASAWLLYMPLIAGVMGGMRMAKQWLWVALIILLALWILPYLGISFPNMTPEAFQTRQDRVQQLIQLLGVGLAIVGLIGQVEASEQAMEQTICTLKESVQARVKAEQQASSALARQQAFFTSMSHELRTPLNAIIGFARLLLQRSEGELVRARDIDVASRIKANGDDLLALVNQLLALKQNIYQQPLLHKERVNLVTLVQQVCADLASLVSANVTLQQVLPEQCWTVIDESLVRRILVNLIGNGLKFTQRGYVRVRLSYTDTELNIAVEDTGEGISESDLALLFEPYTRGVGKEDTEGSGLGLALSKQWAEMLGGQLSVESQLGQGSCFTLTLPIGDK